jgi:hypothetical protein
MGGRITPVTSLKNNCPGSEYELDRFLLPRAGGERIAIDPLLDKGATLAPAQVLRTALLLIRDPAARLANETDVPQVVGKKPPQ